MSTVATIERTDAGTRGSVLDALRGLRGRATVADIVAATGLVQAKANDALRDLLETHTGHVEVGEKGDLVYAFDPKLLERDHVPWWKRFWGGVKRAGKVAFKAWIAVMLVGYFVLFLVLAVALLVFAMVKGGGDDIDFGGDGFSPDILWLLFWAPDWRWGAPYYGQRYSRRRKVPFYKKVFAFAFGPDEPQPTPEARDREWLRMIRARRGVVTAADAVLFSGLAESDAHDELGRLLGAYDGDARATQDGEVVYLFPELMVSAHGEVRERVPKPAWKRLLPKRMLTGNTKGANVLIGGMNAFNLIGVSAAIAFFAAAPTAGAAAWAGLVWIPLTFSVLFFAIPFVRSFAVRRENRRRLEANLRRVVLGPVTEATLEGRALTLDEVVDRVQAGLPDARLARSGIEGVLRTLAAEFDGEAEAGPDGVVAWRFPSLARQIEAGVGARAAARLEERRVGAVVYSSADDGIEAGRREIETFDRDLARSLESPSVAWLDEFEMAGLPTPVPEPEPARPGRRRR